ncbi:hypothetical protein CKA81_06190 [Pollutimonas thiosulfatoxidans]|uniref:Peptidoglycan binding-like domain-containing protein n=2 Tax=Pollutimonas thiosulfatoxidans TaxID=2028345 RepID=A0A410GB06_9BURK|nr:hypothetical protein CKA81_06190 [Pollutimonas thiosulfatoxidans]
MADLCMVSESGTQANCRRRRLCWGVWASCVLLMGFLLWMPNATAQNINDILRILMPPSQQQQAVPPPVYVPPPTYSPPATHSRQHVPKPGVSRAETQQAQHMLNELGYDAGPADGAAGHRTISALNAFQRANGLAVTASIEKQGLATLAAIHRHIVASNALTMQTEPSAAAASPASLPADALPSPSASAIVRPDSATLAHPSFDCTRASTPTETTLCSNAALAMLDVQLSELYSRQLSGQGPQKAKAQQEQRHWLAQRNRCGADASCLFNAYSERIAQLGSPSQANASPAASQTATLSTTNQVVQAKPSTPSSVMTKATQSSAASPAASMDRVPMMLVVGKGTKARTFKEFVAEAKANPGSITYASSGEGSAHHLAMETLSQRAGLNIVHIPFRSSATALFDVAGGQVSAMMANLDTSKALIQSGKVVPIAVAHATRLPEFPNVPTLTEEGIEGVEAAALAGTRKAPAAPADPALNYSSRENQLMASPGRLPVIVPETYSEPDEEEIRLAIMRDMAAGGGRMLSPTAVEIGAPPFDQLMPIRLDATKVEKESCNPMTGRLAYTCEFRLYLKVSMPPQSMGFLRMGGGNEFFENLLDKQLASVNNATPGLKAHVFVLTDQGWRSPSMRKESIDATLKTYSETLSDWPECRLVQVGNELRCD